MIELKEIPISGTLFQDAFVMALFDKVKSIVTPLFPDCDTTWLESEYRLVSSLQDPELRTRVAKRVKRELDNEPNNDKVNLRIEVDYQRQLPRPHIAAIKRLEQTANSLDKQGMDIEYLMMKAVENLWIKNKTIKKVIRQKLRKDAKKSVRKKKGNARKSPPHRGHKKKERGHRSTIHRESQKSQENTRRDARPETKER